MIAVIIIAKISYTLMEYQAQPGTLGFDYINSLILTTPVILTLRMGRASLIAQLVKSPPAMWETWVRTLGWEDPLEKEMATHSSTAWRIPWTEEPGRLQSIGSQRVRHD